MFHDKKRLWHNSGIMEIFVTFGFTFDILMDYLQILHVPNESSQENWPLTISLEHSDKIHWKGVIHHLKKGCDGFDTKLHLMMRLQVWRSGECEV